LTGLVNDVEYFVGNIKIVKNIVATFDATKLEQYTSQGKNADNYSYKEKVLGFIMVADEIKAESNKRLPIFTTWY